MGGAQSVYNKIREQDERLAEWERTSTSTTTPAPPMEFHDKADLSVSNEVNHESADVTLDQSNHGFLFINLHWASFSTDLSSVLAVIDDGEDRGQVGAKTCPMQVDEQEAMVGLIQGDIRGLVVDFIGDREVCLVVELHWWGRRGC